MLNQFQQFLKRGATWGIYVGVAGLGFSMIHQHQKNRDPGRITTYVLTQYLRVLGWTEHTPSSLEENTKKKAKSP